MKILLYAMGICSICLGMSCNTSKPYSTNQKTDSKWWKEAIIYQIYPRSFKDSNNDGIGDLKGIIQKLDYLKSLGINTIWLNPIYSSPNADNGYDVSDYKAIMKEFGTMQDFELLVDEMHKRNIRLIMDIVVNHSSDEHEWFRQSRSSRNNPYRNYYHWWPAEKGKPNHRYSLFAADGNAWKYDSITNAYYLHYFSEKQPDLNWENPKLRAEVFDIMKFWSNKRVDAFRLDAFQFVAKDTTFAQINDNLEKNFIQYYAMQGKIHDYLKEMNTEVLEKYHVMAVAEGAGRNFEDAHHLVDEERKELQMAYAFEGVDLPKKEGLDLAKMKNVYSKWDAEFSEKGWLAIFLSNHDQARMVSRWANDKPQFRTQATNMLNTFILTMRGTPFCYYGDELGMTNIHFNKIEQYKDIQAISSYQKAKSHGENMAIFMQNLQFSSRDNGRTPMQWNQNSFAGFSTAKPWIDVNPNYTTINVANQEKDTNSCLQFFKKLTQLRLSNPLWVYGRYELIQKEHPYIYAYTRSYEGQKKLVLLNFSKNKSTFDLKGLKINNKAILNNYSEIQIHQNIIEMQAFQALILDCI